MTRANLLALLLALASAQVQAQPAADTTGDYYLPDGLADCKVYRIEHRGWGADVTTVRCPNSSTTVRYPRGKTQVTTTIIETQKGTNDEKIVDNCRYDVATGHVLCRSRD